MGEHYFGVASGTWRRSHESARYLPGSDPLLNPEEARHEVEELMAQFPILYPNAAIVHSVPLGAASYRISWCGAHMWAYAEHYELEEFVSEGFEDGRQFGSVWIRNPFLAR